MEKERLDNIWDLLDSYETPRVSDDFTRSLMRRVRSGQAPTRVRVPTGDPPQWRFAWRVASGMAACLAVVFTLGILWSRSWEHDPGKTTPRHPGETTRTVTDEQIIKDLEIYEDLELLKNLEFLSDLDVVETLDETSP